MDYHTPALLKESIEGLKIKPGGVYIDLTYGAGGHSKEIIKKLKTGKLIAFDQDSDAEKNVVGDDRLIFVRSNFRFFYNFIKYYGFSKVDGIIADLGISSFHIDNPERGFSYRFDGVLDMRMNKDSVLTAKTVINTYDQNRLIQILSDYGEVENPGKLAQIIINKRKLNEIVTTGQLRDAISVCIPRHNENKYLSKVFQAIRIEVNNEIEVLKKMLLITKDVIRKDGRLVIITYNSLEDKIVKNFIRKGKFEGDIEKDFYGNINVPFEQVNKKPIIPNEEEIEMNNRARSAKLRIAVKN
jgi:16S rRNA (cytosine1402-N4)-methyltransferase